MKNRADLRTSYLYDYYAFAFRPAARPTQARIIPIYNGNEWNSDLSLNSYDYGARFYDPVIGRFISVDPLTDKYPWYSQYQFAGNEVPNAIDLDGLEPAYPQPNGTFTTARDGELQKPLSALEQKNLQGFTGGARGGHERFINALDGFGSSLQGVGYTAAPFTGGVSLSLVPAGALLSGTSAALSVADNPNKGDYSGAALTTASEVGFGKLMTKFGKLEKLGEIGGVQKNLLRGMTVATEALTENVIDQVKQSSTSHTFNSVTQKGVTKLLSPPPSPNAPSDNTIVKPYIKP